MAMVNVWCMLSLDGSGPGPEAELQLHVHASGGVREPLSHPYCPEGKHRGGHHGGPAEVQERGLQEAPEGAIGGDLSYMAKGFLPYSVV